MCFLYYTILSFNLGIIHFKFRLYYIINVLSYSYTMVKPKMVIRRGIKEEEEK